MPPDQDQRLAVGVGDQQWLGEQGAERCPALRPFLGWDHASALMMAPRP
jgi:hypothetical protein